MKNWKMKCPLVSMVCVVLIGGPTVSAQVPCTSTITASPALAELDSGEHENQQFTVNNAGECFWKVTGVFDSDTSPANPIYWLDITNYSWNALMPDTVSYHVDENTGNERTAYIYVDGQWVHKVVQEGVCQVTPVNAPSSVDAVYVTWPGCESIALIDGSSSPPVFELEDSGYAGLVYGPESVSSDVVYALDPTRGLIDKITFSPTSYSIDTIYDRSAFIGTDLEFWPRFGGFNQYGDLLVTADTGLFRFHNFSPIGEGIDFFGGGTPLPEPVSPGDFAGIDFDANGDLFVSGASGTVYQFEFDAQDRSYTLAGSVTTGLTDPIGVARTANRDAFVADDMLLMRFGYDPDTETWSQATCGPQDFNSQTVISVEASANDTLYVTTRSGGNATLWEVPFGYEPCSSSTTFSCGTAAILATFKGPAAAPDLAVDVALPFSGREAWAGECSETFTQDAKPVDRDGDGIYEGWNFFDLFATFEDNNPTGGECEVQISSRQISPLEIASVIGAETKLQPSRPLVLPGDGGFMRVLDYIPVGGDCTDTPGDPQYERAVSAFFTRVNPKLALCHDSNLTNCNLQRLVSIDLEFGDIPDDGRIRGSDPRFSEGFLVDQVPPAEKYAGKWCGVDPPLSNDEPWPSFNSGSDVPIDIKPVKAADQCGGRSKTIPDLIAVLSVTYVSGPDGGPYEVDFEDLTFVGNVSQDDYRAVFDAPKTTKKPYSLNWKTVDRDGDPLPEGFYKLTIIDDSAATLGGTEVYFPPQSVYLYLN